MLQSSMWRLFQSLPHVRRYHFYYVVRTYSTYGLCILLSTHVHTYFFMISRTKFTKNVLVGSPAVLIREEIHCNEYPGTRRVMRVGYPGRKFSTRFNPSTFVYTRKVYTYSHLEIFICIYSVIGVRLTKYQQIHRDIQCAAHQMFTCLFTHWLEPRLYL